ncbi:hypothetical protein ElyMa_006442800 [Elysia marginata]|uniref:Uncharacterized protein n=1 Tax=Elysia marginata TaxID=1093978 RepID=A0AAV4HWQ6_9GAST|nr:hypothetical protein ElyMa_006442800 [Elysia marginata]
MEAAILKLDFPCFVWCIGSDLLTQLTKPNKRLFNTPEFRCATAAHKNLWGGSVLFWPNEPPLTKLPTVIVTSLRSEADIRVIDGHHHHTHRQTDPDIHRQTDKQIQSSIDRQTNRSRHT